jgi:hypothetical protein
MHGILDDVLVGAVFLASIVYAAYSLGPRTLRQRAMHRAAAMLHRLPTLLHAQGMALRLETAASKGKGACGGCDSCGEHSSTTPAGSAGAAEINIPLSKIGRR